MTLCLPGQSLPDESAVEHFRALLQDQSPGEHYHIQQKCSLDPILAAKYVKFPPHHIQFHTLFAVGAHGVLSCEGCPPLSRERIQHATQDSSLCTCRWYRNQILPYIFTPFEGNQNISLYLY